MLSSPKDLIPINTRCSDYFIPYEIGMNVGCIGITKRSLEYGLLEYHPHVSNSKISKYLIPSYYWISDHSLFLQAYYYHFSYLLFLFGFS